GAQDAVAALSADLGLRPRAQAEVEDLADVVLHQAELGVRCLLDITLPSALEADECWAALRLFVDRALAALLIGVVGALFRRAGDDKSDPTLPVLGSHF